VVVADVSDDGASETVVAVENKGRKALFVHTDVSDAAAVDALMQKAADAFGRLDILVTAAGVSYSSCQSSSDVQGTLARAMADPANLLDELRRFTDCRWLRGRR